MWQGIQNTYQVLADKHSYQSSEGLNFHFIPGYPEACHFSIFRASWETMECREPAYCILSAYYILSAALSTASSFRVWNSSTGILSLPGASVRSSTHDKGHEEGGSACAKAGSSLRSPPGNSRASTPQNQSLPTFCFVLSPTPLTLRGAVPHYLSLKKELAYSSS